MSIPAREKAMTDFRESEDLRIMIASLKAGGIGLDLTMANKCILIDPWWNEAVQQQVSKDTVFNTHNFYVRKHLSLSNPTRRIADYSASDRREKWKL